MKKIIFILAILPVFAWGQSITNTLGSNGTFIVEDNTNKDVLLINPSSVFQEFIFGLQPLGFDPFAKLPVGQFTFISGVLPATVNLVTASTSVDGGSFLELIRERGSLNSPSILLAGDRLGAINFGAYRNSDWATSLSSISSNIATVTGANPAVYSTNLTFATTQTDGTTKNIMTFDNAGNLTVPGLAGANTIPVQTTASGTLVRSSALTGVTLAPAIRQVSASTTALTTDQTLLATTTGTTNVTITLPLASSVPVGKIYTIKKLANGNNWVLNLNPTSPNTIDGLGTQQVGNGNFYPYMTVQSNGTNWFIIAKGTAQ